MEPMDWLENEELLRFFRCKKTEMSCMENPQTFLRQLRDHDLVPEDRYKKVSRMKSKNIRKGLYDILDWLERKRPKSVRKFWRCVFKQTILNQYPTLQLLHNSLMDELESGERKMKELSEGKEGEEKQENSVKKKRKLRSSVCVDEEEPAGPSAQLTPRKRSKKISFSSDEDEGEEEDPDLDEEDKVSSSSKESSAAVTDEEEEEQTEQQPKTRKRSKKTSFSSPLKKGGKNNTGSQSICKLRLPVTCGNKKGILNRDKLAKGEKCIVETGTRKQWFTPSQFEKEGGRKSSRNWKLSIRCMGTTLGKLIEDGHLKAGNYRGGCKKAKK